MEEYRVYLLQYSKGREKLNRFYASSGKPNEELLVNIEDFTQTKKNETLESIAALVETEYLNEQDFIILRGLKRILPCYKEFLNNIYPIKISQSTK